jgi:hypothetical protein
MTLTQKISPAIQRPASYNDRGPLILCPITRHPCEGDLAYLCEDYGCARKGGVPSPVVLEFGDAISGI